MTFFANMEEGLPKYIKTGIDRNSVTPFESGFSILIRRK